MKLTFSETRMPQRLSHARVEVTDTLAPAPFSVPSNEAARIGAFDSTCCFKAYLHSSPFSSVVERATRNSSEFRYGEVACSIQAVGRLFCFSCVGCTHIRPKERGSQCARTLSCEAMTLGVMSNCMRKLLHSEVYQW